MEEELKTKTEESIKKILKEGITTNNLDYLYKLSKINHIAKEGENNMYGNYGGRRAGYDSYGRGNYGEYGEGSYGRRGYDIKYRGDDHLDRIGNEYGRYMEARERYGAEEANRSFEYMVKSLEDFVKYLHEEAQTPQHHQMLNEALQRSMR